MACGRFRECHDCCERQRWGRQLTIRFAPFWPPDRLSPRARPGAHPELVQLSLKAALVVRGSLRSHLTMRACETQVPSKTSS